MLVFLFRFGHSTGTCPQQECLHSTASLRLFRLLHKTPYVPNSCVGIYSVSGMIVQPHLLTYPMSAYESLNPLSISLPIFRIKCMTRTFSRSLLAQNSKALYFPFYNFESFCRRLSPLSVLSYFSLETKWWIQIMPGLKMGERNQIISKVDLDHFSVWLETK